MLLLLMIYICNVICNDLHMYYGLLPEIKLSYLILVLGIHAFVHPIQLHVEMIIIYQLTSVDNIIAMLTNNY